MCEMLGNLRLTNAAVAVDDQLNADLSLNYIKPAPAAWVMSHWIELDWEYAGSRVWPSGDGAWTES